MCICICVGVCVWVCMYLLAVGVLCKCLLLLWLLPRASPRTWQYGLRCGKYIMPHMLPCQWPECTPQLDVTYTCTHLHIHMHTRVRAVHVKFICLCFVVVFGYNAFHISSALTSILYQPFKIHHSQHFILIFIVVPFLYVWAITWVCRNDYKLFTTNNICAMYT